MRSTESTNTASTGSMSRLKPRIQAETAVWNAEELGVHAVCEAQHHKIMLALAVHDLETIPLRLSTPVAPTESSLLQLPLLGRSGNVFCELSA